MVVVFNALDRESLVKIAELMISELTPALKDKGIELKVEKEALYTICDLANGGKYAARDLRHTIRKHIEDPMAQLYTQSDELEIKQFCITAEDGKIKVEKK